MPTDSSAPHEVQTHDTPDLDAFLGRYLDAAYRLAVVILRDRVAAEDAVQDAMLQAWRSRGSLRDTGAMEGWFRRILVNSCRDRLRVRARRPIVDLTLVDAPALADPTAQADDRAELLRIIRRLDPDDQVLLALRFFRDLTVPEIASTLGMPEGTVKSRLHRVFERIRTDERRIDGRWGR